MWRHVVVTLGLSLVFCSGATGQRVSSPDDPLTQASPIETQPTAPPAEIVSLPHLADDYKVGAGDVLDIQIIDHADMHQNLRISSTGEISFPMLGLVKVADLTTFDIEATIAEMLSEKGLINQADVLVDVSEYQAKPIYVWGAVVNPGEFVMSQQLSAVDAILLAGGLTPTAADEAFLHRRTSPSAEAWPAPAVADHPEVVPAGSELITVDLRKFKEGHFLDISLPLQGGDVVVVPQRAVKLFFVVGEVNDPRNYIYPPDRSITASQAISWAQGPLATAKLSDGMLIRYDDQGKREEKPVNYEAILNGKQPDFLIQPNDIIFIPGSKVKTITHGLLLLSDTMVMQQSFRIGRRIQLPESPNRTRVDAPDTP